MQCRYCQHKTHHDHKHRKRHHDVVNSMPYYELCIRTRLSNAEVGAVTCLVGKVNFIAPSKDELVVVLLDKLFRPNFLN